MFNYINKKEDNKLYIVINNILEVKDITFQKYINNLLKKNLTTLAVREKTAKKYLNIKSKVPIYIDKQQLLMCIRSFRLENTFYINYYSILNYELYRDYVIIIFINNHCIKIKEKSIFISQLKKCKKIIEYINK